VIGLEGELGREEGVWRRERRCHGKCSRSLRNYTVETGSKEVAQESRKYRHGGYRQERP